MSQPSETLSLLEGVRYPRRHPEIEAEIPGPEPAALVPTLLSISKATRALTGLLLAEIDLNAGQDQLLDALDSDRSICVSIVSTVINVRPSTTSKMVDRLIRKGLVERCAADGFKDARLTLLRLTPAGVAKRAEVHRLWARLEHGLTDRSEAIDNDEVAAALRTVEAVIKRRLSRLR